jgi:hypothetical protein
LVLAECGYLVNAITGVDGYWRSVSAADECTESLVGTAEKVWVGDPDDVDIGWCEGDQYVRSVMVIEANLSQAEADRLNR